MLALIASPAIKSAFDFGFRREDKAAEADRVARLIADLHGILVNPDAAPGAAAAAKQMLLGVLERTKAMRLPQMIVPPITSAHASDGGRSRETGRYQSHLRHRRTHHYSASYTVRDTLSKKARASSSLSFRAKLSDARRGRAASHAAPRKSHSITFNDLHDAQNSYDEPTCNTSRL